MVHSNFPIELVSFTPQTMEVSGGFDLKPEAAVALLESVDLGESLATLGVPWHHPSHSTMA